MSKGQSFIHPLQSSPYLRLTPTIRPSHCHLSSSSASAQPNTQSNNQPLKKTVFDADAGHRACSFIPTQNQLVRPRECVCVWLRCRAVASGNLTCSAQFDDADPPHGIHLFWVLACVASPRLSSLRGHPGSCSPSQHHPYKSLPHSRLGTPALPVHVRIPTCHLPTQLQVILSSDLDISRPRHSRLFLLHTTPLTLTARAITAKFISSKFSFAFPAYESCLIFTSSSSSSFLLSLTSRRPRFAHLTHSSTEACVCQDARHGLNISLSEQTN